MNESLKLKSTGTIGKPPKRKIATGKPSVNAKQAKGITGVAIATPKIRECAFCKGNHKSRDCDSFTNYRSRAERLKGPMQCLICLGKHKGHNTKACPVYNPCSLCREMHHVALCPTRYPSEREDQEEKCSSLIPYGRQVEAKETVLTQEVVAEMQKEFPQVIETVPEDELPSKLEEFEKRWLQSHVKEKAWKTLYERERKEVEDLKVLLQRALEPNKCQRCGYYKKMLMGITNTAESVNAEVEQTFERAVNLFKASTETIRKCKVIAIHTVRNSEAANKSGLETPATVEDKQVEGTAEAKSTTEEKAMDSVEESILDDPVEPKKD